MGFIDDYQIPWNLAYRFCVILEQFIVYDYNVLPSQATFPALYVNRLESGGAPLFDLAAPVDLQGRRTDDENAARVYGVCESDRLNCFT